MLIKLYFLPRGLKKDSKYYEANFLEDLFKTN